jgi:hypothetical protein
MVWLIRSVPTNPIVYQKFLKHLLADVHFGAVKKRFGMFFIHDLDPENCYIPGLMPELSEDCDDFYAAINAPLPVRHQPEPDASDGKADDPGVPGFPLGQEPHWKDIVEILAKAPKKFVKPFEIEDEEAFPNGLQDWERNNLQAADLFIKFTRNFALSLDQRVLIGSIRTNELRTLHKCLKFWTVKELETRMSRVVFVACNSDIVQPGKRNRHPNFQERRPHFFLPVDTGWTDISIWRSLITAGYIRDYHETLQELMDAETQDRIDHIDSGLDHLFSIMQCLPTSKRPTKGNGGFLWQRGDDRNDPNVEIIVNPRYYRLIEIYNQHMEPTFLTEQKKKMLLTISTNALMKLLVHEHNRHEEFNDANPGTKPMKKKKGAPRIRKGDGAKARNLVAARLKMAERRKAAKAVLSEEEKKKERKDFFAHTRVDDGRTVFLKSDTSEDDVEDKEEDKEGGGEYRESPHSDTTID